MLASCLFLTGVSEGLEIDLLLKLSDLSCEKGCGREKIGVQGQLAKVGELELSFLSSSPSQQLPSQDHVLLPPDQGFLRTASTSWDNPLSIGLSPSSLNGPRLS